MAGHLGAPVKHTAFIQKTPRHWEHYGKYEKEWA
jgi:hypothetical protein